METKLARIKRYPGYLFGSDGSVFSEISMRFLKQQKRNGYLSVTLCCRGVKYQVLVHRVIAEAFHGSPDSASHCVNHKNLNRVDNRAENLEWVTQSENVKHAYRLGARVIDDCHSERCRNLGLSKRKTDSSTEDKICEMYRGERGDLTRIARSFGFDRCVVKRVLRERGLYNGG